MAHPIRRIDLSDQKTIDLWVVDLDDRSIPPATLDSLLDADELDRASRFIFEPDAWHFKLCRAMLRLGLALHLEKDVRQIHIEITDRGKPYLAHSGLHFNVSHCGGIGLLAFTFSGEIGLDVEAVRTDVDALEIAAQYFHPREIALIASSPNVLEQNRLFTRLWTRREALLKATGAGIADGMKSLDVSDAPNAVFRLEILAGKPGQTALIVRDVEVREGVLGALAGHDCEWTVLQSGPILQDLLPRVIFDAPK